MSKRRSSDDQWEPGDGPTKRKKQDETPAQYKTEEFLKLQREWYGKLKDDGFDDIERGDGTLTDHDPFFPEMQAHRKEQRRLRGQEDDVEFFRLMEQWINVYRWYTRRERWFWSELMNGRTVADIHRTHPAVDPKQSYDGFKSVMRRAKAYMMQDIRERIPETDIEA